MFSMEDFERASGNYSDGGITKASLMEEGDLQEDEAWSVLMKTTEGPKSNLNSKTRKNVVCSPPASAWRSADAISSKRGGQAEDSAVVFVAQHSSAPMDIPDRSKILKMKSKENYLQLWDDDDDACDDPNDDDSDDGGIKTHYAKNDDEMVPPHEYLARKLASKQIASFSMCEGVGRTLKGRDLSKTRNAVLTKTGFLE